MSARDRRRWGVPLGMLWLVIAASQVRAQTTAVATVTTDYDFRGETQTDLGPALQLTWDRMSGNGAHLAVFLSNVHFSTADHMRGPGLELNPSAEWLHDVGAGVTLGAGATYYWYGDHGASHLNYGEFSVSAANRYVKTLLAYAPAYDGNTNSRHYPAWYLGSELNVPAVGRLAVTGHVGYAWGPYWSLVQRDTKLDGSAGLTFSIGRTVLRLQLVARRYLNGAPPQVAGTRAILSVDTPLLP